MGLFILILCLPSILLTIDFLRYLVVRKRYIKGIGKIVIDLCTLVVLPALYLSFFDPAFNECCTDSATFSPEHKLTIDFWIFIIIVAYLLSTYKKEIISPIVEVLINVMLVIGIIFNVFIAIHVEEYFGLIGNVPIIILFVFELLRNHDLHIQQYMKIEVLDMGKFEHFLWKILNTELFVKIPILFLLCFPVLLSLSLFLMLFGQKPDSFIRAFTDTYKHGFSQLDHLCDNVECGGHFLCSVAANGHKKLVSPKRYGIRGGGKIICNRQLLIANAFEDLIQEKTPKIHHQIRTHYNKVGDQIHRYYDVFNIKIISDIIYVLMKPLEWMFLLTLYTFDRNPENRISKQYVSAKHRMLINERLRNKKL